MTPRVLLVDDHALVRSGLRSLLSASSEVNVVGEFGTGREALDKCAQLEPDVVLTDVEMPQLNGIDLTRQILELCPATAVIMVTMHSSQQYVLESLRAGASGYVLKDAALAELLTAIKTVCGGARYLSPALVDFVVTDYVRQANGEAPASALNKLSNREREVLQLIAEGYTSGQVRLALHISVRTVDAHRANIMQKLNIHSIAGLTKFAIMHGITSTNYRSGERKAQPKQAEEGIGRSRPPGDR
jgi:DNA-binding NarL/FixJ family response regulator